MTETGSWYHGKMQTTIYDHVIVKRSFMKVMSVNRSCVTDSGYKLITFNGDIMDKKGISWEDAIILAWNKAKYDLIQDIENRFKNKKPSKYDERFPDYMISILPDEWEEMKKKHILRK